MLTTRRIMALIIIMSLLFLLKLVHYFFKLWSGQIIISKWGSFGEFLIELHNEIGFEIKKFSHNPTREG